MAEISPRERLALHAFSVWYRSTYAHKHPFSPPGIGSVIVAVQNEYHIEQAAQHSPSVETAEPKREREPMEPEL